MAQPGRAPGSGPGGPEFKSLRPDHFPFRFQTTYGYLMRFGVRRGLHIVPTLVLSRAPEITYFDPAVEKRVDGLQAMRAYLTPFTGRIKVDHYDMIAPKVQRHGSVAVLTYNLISYGKMQDGPDTILARWNSTEVYALVEGGWKIVHNHWSYIKPELKQPVRE